MGVDPLPILPSENKFQDYVIVHELLHLRYPTHNHGRVFKQICPIKDKAVAANLKHIVKIRDEVEHAFFVGGDEYFGPLFQACCVNFEKYMTEWFGTHLSLAKELSLALQFARLQKDQLVELEKGNLPPTIKAITDEIQGSEFADSNAFQLKVYYSTEVSSKVPCGANPSVTIEKLYYSGDFGGILCHLAEHSLVCSLTHLRFPPSCSLYRDITAYQKHRVKKLKKQAA